MKKFFLIYLFSFLAFNLNAQDLKQTVEKGVATCERQVDNHEWREAFATLRALDATIGNGNPDLHYLVSKQRFRIYSRINKKAEAKSNLDIMEAFARQSQKNDVVEDMLMAKAYYLRNNGNISLAQQCYKEVFNMHSAGKDDAGMDKCFQTMLAQAKEQKNGLMANMIEGMYTEWKDSIAAVRAAKELSEVKAQFDEAKQSIEEKDSKITAQSVFITILIVLSIALAAGLAFFVLVMLRNVSKIKKLTSSLEIANQNNEQKSIFINSIGEQIEPSLDAIAAGDAKLHIKALKAFMEHLKAYIELENSRDEFYKRSDLNMGNVFDKIVDEAKQSITGSTPITFEARAINFSTNEQAVKELVLSLLKQISLHKETKEINLDVKKRNPHTVHCIITAVDMDVPAEKRAGMFQAFSEIHDLTKDDGLALPTCSLIAHRLNGLLRLDNDFKHGIRFVLELHSK